MWFPHFYSFHFQHPLFHADAVAGRKAAEGAGAADDAVARNDDGIPVIGHDVANGSGGTRLDWVGRNHGKKNHSDYDDRKTNFLYCDGHVETKNIRDTVEPFEWGDKFFTLSPNSDIAN